VQSLSAFSSPFLHSSLLQFPTERRGLVPLLNYNYTGYTDIPWWLLHQNYTRYIYVIHSVQYTIILSVQCLATGWTTRRLRFDRRQRWKDFSSSLCDQTGSGAHPASCTMGTGGPFPGAKAWPGRDADHSPHLVPRSRKSRSYISSPHKRPRGV
jgi:hypothetical protein